MRHLLFALIAAAVLYVVVARLNAYNQYQVGEIAAYVVALVGLSLLTGTNGQISLGHGAFMAVGAYSMALLMNHSGSSTSSSSWLPRPGVAAAAGLVIGLPATPLEGSLPGGHDAPLRPGGAVHRRQVARHVRRRPGSDDHRADRAGIVDRRGMVGADTDHRRPDRDGPGGQLIVEPLRPRL